jgi:OmpA family/PEGA domain
MQSRITTLVLSAFLLCATVASLAQQAKVRVEVQPPEAYVFVDNQAVGEGSRTITLTPGEHHFAIYNYGYGAQMHTLTLKEGSNESLRVRLEKTGEDVSGPWGRIQIEGAPRAAVLLNGKTPEYLVGHGDEFNHNFIWKQQLIVPPGTHQLTLMEKDKEVWSGPVTVGANQRVIVYVGQGGKQVTKAWNSGASIKSLPRFKAGVASTTVAVAPVTSSMSVGPAQVNCGESTRLAWNSKEALHTSIVSDAETLSDLPASGERSVQPTRTTTYNFQAAGPGGVVKSSATVDVNNAIQSSLAVTPGELRYRKIGDKVVEQGTANLQWSATNASSVSIEPVGAVDPSGQKTVQPAPKQTTEGAVDELQTYTLTAKNNCGGTETRTASVRVTGAIEPLPQIVLGSVFFPTGYPDERHPQTGLVRSQQAVLTQAVHSFKKYLEYDSAAQLKLVANADERDSKKRNQTLSERRAQRVKDYLISAGVPAGSIQTVAQGEEHQLSPSTIRTLEQQNPNKARRKRANWQTIVWAYNRRVDVVLLPTGFASVQFFPHHADDVNLLQNAEWQSGRVIERASQMKGSEEAGSQPVPIASARQ